ncbi:MAG: polymer-forming cytoskeletal protein [Ignavibacteriae bacterium]|nr:polymer-forming cytoskeletal protein [Ignavibacteriota bacterium]
MFDKKENGVSGGNDQIRTLISEGCKFEGNLFSPSSTRIDGVIEGDLSGEKSIIVGDKGSIKGNIKAPDVVVYGDVTGDITTDNLTIKQNGTVNGNLDLSYFTMERGGKFNGSCKTKGMSPEPQKKLIIDDSSTAEEEIQ